MINVKSNLIFLFLIKLLIFKYSNGHGYLAEPPSRSSMWFFGYGTPANYDHMGLNCGGFYRQWGVNQGRCGICGDPWDAHPRPNESGGKFATGLIVRNYTEGQLNLPESLTCEQCVLQWKYNTGNSWGTDDTGRSCVGCGPQEQFYGCADVRIQSASNNPSNWANNDGNLHTTTGRDWARNYQSFDTVEIDNKTTNQTVTRVQDSTTSTHSKARNDVEDTLESTATSSPTTNLEETTVRMSSNSRGSYNGIFNTIPSNSSHINAYSDTASTTREYQTTSSTTVKLTSTATISTYYSGNQRCRAAGLYVNTPGMNEWCIINCAQGFCPSTHCHCSDREGSDESNRGSKDGGNGSRGAECRATGAWKNDRNMDNWCVTNCAAGYCPASHCVCD